MRRLYLRCLAMALVVAAAGPALAAPTCPISYGAADDAKPNKLYLYFPTADDATYPEFGLGGAMTSPAHRFDATELPNYTGSIADLRNAITDVVTDDYCEFNVQVRQTTTSPPTTFPRRNTVAIGSDANVTTCGVDDTWGLAQNVDTGDATAVDFARVWAGTYQQCAAAPAGGALNGANSTLERWAKSIGGTAAHEGGHNYGESHADGLPVAPGEDPLVHHIMASGSHFSYADRAGYRRHFSDHEFSILASNVGLSIQTMWNWDLVNPNAQTAAKLRMDFLSTKPSLIVSWFYGGSLSPWVNPVVSGPSGTTVFKGTTYNRYQLEWSTGQPWSGGSSGQVPGGAGFHVGATFSGVDFTSPDAIIITDIALLDGSNNPLALRPRHLGFDAGTLDSIAGTLDLRFFNVADRVLILQNLVVQELPRVMSLNAMVPGGKMVDPYGQAFRPWPRSVRTVVKRQAVERGQEVKVTLGRLNQPRHIYEVITERNCQDGQDRLKGPDARCRPGISVDLFPATTLLITANVVDPQAKYWDPRRKRYVTGPVTSQLFYQIAGRHPDLNRNGVDDYIDIRTGRSRDRNGTGVPEDAR
jgi:hypothetical protein